MRCPICGSPWLRWKERLGRLIHGQCRDCGMVYHQEEAVEAKEAA